MFWKFNFGGLPNQVNSLHLRCPTLSNYVTAVRAFVGEGYSFLLALRAGVVPAGWLTRCLCRHQSVSLRDSRGTQLTKSLRSSSACWEAPKLRALDMLLHFYQKTSDAVNGPPVRDYASTSTRKMLTTQFKGQSQNYSICSFSSGAFRNQSALT
jgi:hypothetical protein